MPRYVFSQGKVTVEDGVYLPVLRDDKPKRRGVLIVVQPSSPNKPDESTHERGQSHER